MKNVYAPCECGSTKFVTQPNQYDVYELIDGELEYQRTELFNEKVVLSCRECNKKYETDYSIEI